MAFTSAGLMLINTSVLDFCMVGSGYGIGFGACVVDWPYLQIGLGFYLPARQQRSLGFCFSQVSIILSPMVAGTKALVCQNIDRPFMRLDR